MSTSDYELRVKLPIERSIYGRIAALAHSRDWELNQLVIKDDNVQSFYSICNDNNIKIL